MGLLSHKVKRSDLEAGDHVYVYRTLKIYSHHGIYVGGNMVVHMGVDNKSPCSASSDKHGCGFRKAGSAVKRTCLDCFLGKGSPRRYKYGVEKATFLAYRAGTCTMAESDDAKTVIHRANYLLENGFGDYHFLDNNCEVFALYCKTGLITLDGAGSGQAAGVVQPITFATQAGFVAISTVNLHLTATVPVVGFFAAVAIASWSVNASIKYGSDISKREQGVHEVEVERLEQFRRDHSSTQ